MTRLNEPRQQKAPDTEHAGEGRHGSRTVLLVAGPHVSNGELRRYCVGALSAGRPVALVQLHPVSASERYLLRALARWYGQHSVRLVESHSDWAAVSHEATVVVLSDRGIWRDDERVAGPARLGSLSRAAMERLYAEPADRSAAEVRR